MNHQREIAGVFAGSASLILIAIGAWRNDFAMIALGIAPIQTMLAFFIGERNGERKAVAEESS